MTNRVILFGELGWLSSETFVRACFRLGDQCGTGDSCDRCSDEDSLTPYYCDLCPRVIGRASDAYVERFDSGEYGCVLCAKCADVVADEFAENVSALDSAYESVALAAWLEDGTRTMLVCFVLSVLLALIYYGGRASSLGKLNPALCGELCAVGEADAGCSCAR